MQTWALVGGASRAHTPYMLTGHASQTHPCSFTCLPTSQVCTKGHVPLSHTHTPDMHTCTHVHTHACTYRHTHHTCMPAVGANSSREVITRALAAPLPCQEGRQRSQGWGQVQSCVEDGWTQQRGTGVKTGGTLGSEVPVGCLQREAAAHPVKNLLGWLFV